jgi:hypothetical protein
MQPTLFSVDPPTCHNNDPSSSSEADDWQKFTGRRATNLNLARELVARFPGHTADELEAKCREHYPDAALLKPYELRRRLSDLKARGDVVTDVPRATAGKKTKQQTYRLYS